MFNLVKQLSSFAFILILSTQLHTVSAQTVWLSTIENNHPSYISSVAFDAEKNSYAVGVIDNHQSQESKTLLLTKYNEAGQVQWQKEWVAKDFFIEPKIISNGQDVYITVTARQEISIEKQTFTRLKKEECIAIFAKLDKQGNVVWIKELSGNSLVDMRGMAFTREGNIVCVGRFQNKLSINNQELNAKYTLNGIVINYTPNGDILWTKQLKGKYNSIWAVSIDKDDRIIVGGHFRDYIQWENSKERNDNATDLAPFVSCLDAKGNEIWTQSAIANSVYSCVFGIATDDNKDVYITGKVEGETVWTGNKIVAQGKQDAFLAKYNAVGEFQWIHTIGDEAKNDADLAMSVNIDKYGSIWWTGNVGNATESIGNIPVKLKGEQNVFLAKCNPNGKIEEATIWGGKGKEYLMNMKFDADDNAFFVGSYKGRTQWKDASLPMSNDKNKAFIAKLSKATITSAVADSWIETANVEIGPNPATKEVNIRIENLGSPLVLFSVSDMKGQVLLKQSIEKQSKWNTQLSVEDWAIGVYLLQFQLENGASIVKKLVKE